MKKTKSRNLFLILFILITSCNVSNTVKQTTIPSNSPSIANTPIQTSSKISSPNIIVSNTPNPSPSQSILVSSTPNSNKIDSTDCFKELATFSGGVYNALGEPIDDVTIEARSIDCPTWFATQKTSFNGRYVFRNAPLGVKIEITAKKQGLTTRTRKQVLLGGGISYPYLNVFDFGKGPNKLDEKNEYLLQDNPEVTSLKINNYLILASDLNATELPNKQDRSPDLISSPVITGIDPNNVVIEMKFSKPMKRESVEDNFRIISTSKFSNNQKSFILDKNTSFLDFTWYGNYDSVKIKVLKPLIYNSSGEEAKYLIDFKEPFKDSNGISSLFNRAFRFSINNINDFCVFSVKNQ